MIKKTIKIRTHVFGEFLPVYIADEIFYKIFLYKFVFFEKRREVFIILELISRVYV